MTDLPARAEDDGTTPRPWFVGDWVRRDGTLVRATYAFDGISGEEPGISVLYGGYDGLEIKAEDLRLIVRAVNAHDALVAALRGCLAFLRSDLGDIAEDIDVYADGVRALAQAGVTP